MTKKKFYLYGLTAVLGPGFVSAQSDNFDDNVIGPQWVSIADNPDSLPVPPIRVVEQNGRLEVIANAPASADLDGVLVSAPSFRLSTADDFEIAVDFRFPGSFVNQAVGDALSLFFGVGRDFPNGTDSAAIGYGVLTTSFSGFTVTGTGPSAAWRIDDVQSTAVPDGPINANPASGTFRAMYDSLADELSFRIEETGVSFADFVPAVNIVGGTWAADSVYVSMGARGNGHSLAAGDAWFDNFEVVSGTIIPEPSVVAGLLLLGGWVFLARRREYRGRE